MWGGLTPRKWQAAAFDEVLRRWDAGDDRGLIVATMGAGKSVALAEVIAHTEGRVAVTAPTLRLVHQLAGTLERRGLDVGRVCTGHRDTSRRVTVTSYDPRSLSHVTDCDVWIADEAHRTNTWAISEWRKSVAPSRSLGFTATPYLADEGDALQLWAGVWYHYDLTQAVRDGVVMLPTFAGVRCTEDDLVEGARAWLEQVDGSGVFSASTRSSADALASALDGVESYHSGQSQAERSDRLARLERGEIRAIVHVACLVEGVDLPWLRWIGLTHPRGSRVAYAQEIGRVLRTYPSKDQVLVWDPFGVADIHSLHDPAALSAALEDIAPDMGPPAQATMQIRDGMITEVYRHIADRIAPDDLPLPCTLTPEGVTFDLDGETIELPSTQYAPRPQDPPDVVWLRHVLDIGLDLDIAAGTRSIPAVMSDDEVAIRNAVLRLHAAGLCRTLPELVRENARKIKAQRIDTYLQSAASWRQLGWLRQKVRGRGLPLLTRLAYAADPPRVSTVYACGLVLGSMERDSEATTKIVEGIGND